MSSVRTVRKRRSSELVIHERGTTTTVIEDTDNERPTSSTPNITIDLTNDDHLVSHEDDEIVFITHKKNRTAIEETVQIVSETPRRPTTPLPVLPPAPPEVTPANSKTLRCTVCLDNYDTIFKEDRQLMSTNCGHIFCKECIQDAMKATKQCPQCRKKLTVKQIHPVSI